MIIGAFDPGKMNGWARIDEDDPESLVWGEFEGSSGLTVAFEKVSYLIVENAFNSPDLNTIVFEMIGAAYYFGSLHGIQVVRQAPYSPHFIQGRFEARKPRKMSQHCWDAVAHLAYYLYVTKKRPQDDRVVNRTISALREGR